LAEARSFATFLCAQSPAHAVSLPPLFWLTAAGSYAVRPNPALAAIFVFGGLRHVVRPPRFGVEVFRADFRAWKQLSGRGSEAELLEGSIGN